MAADLAVIVTARNEADRLGATLRALRATFPGADLWVADDASEDGTATVAAQAGARVVAAPKRLGKGGAATLAAAVLLRDGDPTVVLADADLGESARELRKLVDALDDAAAAARDAVDGPDVHPSFANGADLAIATFRKR